MKLFSLPAAALLAALPFFSTSSGVKAGTILSNPLESTNVFPRASAMGPAFVAVADDASAQFSNPAGLGGLQQVQLAVNSNLWLIDTIQETLLAGFPGPPGTGAFAISGSYLNYGNFEGRDAGGSLAPVYSADRWGLKLGWGMDLSPAFSVGLGLGGSQGTFASFSAQSLSASAGVLWKPFPHLKAGISYDNFGVDSRSASTEDALNLGLSCDFDLSPRDRIIAALGGTVEFSSVNTIQAGMEYGLDSVFFLRAGYQLPLTDNGTGDLTGLTAGVGLVLSGLQFDYAYLPFGDLGASHRVSIGYRFGGDGGDGNLSKSLTAPNASGDNKDKPALRSGNGQEGKISGANHEPKASTGTERPEMKKLTADGNGLKEGEGISVPRPLEEKPAGDKDSLAVQFDIAPDVVAEGSALEKQGKTKEAEEFYRDHTAKNPNDKWGWWSLGNLYNRMKAREKAVECYEKVLQLDPANQAMADWLKKYKAGKP